jgi:coatomer subunit beta'
MEQINPKAAESLADPEEYPNLFPDWQWALEAEERLKPVRQVLLRC